MGKSWTGSVKSAGKLTAFDGIGGGRWSGLFQSGLDEINSLLKKSALSLTFEKATDEKKANVIVRTSDGPIAFEYEGTTYTKNFDGKSLKGHTSLIWREGDPTIEKAFVFLPSDPQIQVANFKNRTAGINILKAILIHEFIHAAGLENPDHSNDDVFYGYPTYNYGSTPNEDKIGIMKNGNYIWFPPFFLSSSTVGKIQALW